MISFLPITSCTPCSNMWSLNLSCCLIDGWMSVWRMTLKEVKCFKLKSHCITDSNCTFQSHTQNLMIRKWLCTLHSIDFFNSTRPRGVFKTRNGGMVLKIRAKVIRYNYSDKIKGLGKPGFIFNLLLARLHMHCTTKFTLYLFDINIQRHSVSMQSFACN